MDGKEFLDAIEEGLEARAAYRDKRHTEGEKRRVEQAEARLTALLAALRQPADEPAP
ncbi:hypothetical protein [Deinococcus apachensis]|uniref:hypothetical protein n=1 Tax=Deinococcus apachensis TaxID=309886 RepID=UPI0003824E53|nr:hypothetical protein [Deinococcus apachensis]